NGSAIEVHGASLAADGTLVATVVENAPGLGAAVDEHVDIAGIITGITSLLNFTLGGQIVVIDLNTKLVLHGIPLGLNVAVDVQGTMTAQGVVLAKKIEIRPQGVGLVRGLVDSVSATTNLLSVAGVNVTTAGSTTWTDKSSQHLRSFKLTDLHVGDYVEARGTSSPTGTLSAARLERRSFTSKKLVLPLP